MKTKKNFLKKLAAVTLGFVMTLGVGAAGYAASAGETRAANPTSPMQYDWDSGTTQPTGWTTSGGSAFASTRFKLGAANNYVMNKVIWDAGTVFESITVSVYGVSNSTTDTTSKFGIYLVNSSGSTVNSLSSSQLTYKASASNATAVDNATVNSNGQHVDYTFSGTGLTSQSTITGIKGNLDVKGSNYVLRRIVVSYTTKAAKTLSSIAATTSSYRTFTQGDSFVGETITATYSDSSTKAVTATFSGYNMSTTGEQTVNVSYTEGGVTKNTSYTITVNARTLSSITVSSNHRSFVQGSTFVGETITAHYNNESTATVTGTYSGYDMDSIGTQTVTASYTEGSITQTFDYDIEVTEPVTLTGIAVTSSTHRTFKIGSAFSKETITATYSDNSTKNVTNSAAFSGYNMSVAGTYTVNVSYSEDGIQKETSYEITVKDYSILPTGTLYPVLLKPSETLGSYAKDYKIGTDTSTDWYNDKAAVTGTATYQSASGSYPAEYKLTNNQYFKFVISGNSDAIASRVIIKLTNTYSSNVEVTNEKGETFNTWTSYGTDSDFDNTYNNYYCNCTGKEITVKNIYSGNTFFVVLRLDVQIPVSYDVTTNLTDCTSNGAAKASTASNYTATLSPASGCDGIKIDSVTINGVAGLYAFSSGVLTIQKANITGPIVITAHGTKSQYTVTASGTGVTFPTEMPKAEYKTAYNLSFNINEGYEAPVSFSVKRGTTTITGATLANNTISVPAADVTAALTITVTATAKTYTLDTSGLNNLSFTPSGTSSLSHGGTFSGSLSVTAEGYTLDGAAISVTMGGQTVSDAYDSQNHTITVSNVSGNIVISGSAEEIKTSIVEIDKSSFSIQEGHSDYITVDATLATLITSSAVKTSGDDVADFIALDTNTNKVEIVGKTGARGTGIYTLTITYDNESSARTTKDFANIQVQVYGDDLLGISLSSTSGSYFLGQNFNTPTVTATYSLSGEQTVDATWSGFDQYTTGTQDVLAEFEGKTAHYTATVSAKDYGTNIPESHVYTYEKVTSAQTDWRGKYLIVYETGSVAMDGSLTTLDAVSNSKSVTINTRSDETKYIETDANGKISNSNIYFTVDYKGSSTSIYSLKSGSGYYISGTTTTAKKSNGIKQDTTNTNYEITFNGTTLESKSSDGQMMLRYNKADGQTRFRFYGSGQEAISLYKFNDDYTPAHYIPSDEKHAIRIAEATCTKTPLYAGDSISASDFSIKVQYDTANTLFDAVPTSISRNTIGEGECEYTLTYSYKWKESLSTADVVTKTIRLTSQAAPILSGISIEYDDEWANTFTRGDDFDATGVHVIASYSNGYDDADVTDSATITPPDMDVANPSAVVNVSYTERDITKETSYNINIQPVRTTEITSITITDPDGVEVPMVDDAYSIVPGVHYSLAFETDGDNKNVSVSGGSATTTVTGNNDLYSTSTQNENNVEFTAVCEDAEETIIINVVAVKSATLTSVSTSDQGASASLEEGVGVFNGYIGNTVSFDLSVLNFTDPVVTPASQTSAVTLNSGSYAENVYSGSLTINSALDEEDYSLVITERGTSEFVEVSFVLSAIEDEIVSIEVTDAVTEYTAGDTFNDNITVEATYTSGKKGNIDSELCNISGYPTGAMKRGSYTVLVSLKDDSSISTSYGITVDKPSGLHIVTSYEEQVYVPTSVEWSLLTSASQLSNNEKVYMYQSDQGYVTGFSGSDATVTTNESNRVEFIVKIVDASAGTFKLQDPNTNNWVSSNAGNTFTISANETNAAVIKVNNNSMMLYTDSSNNDRALGVNVSGSNTYMRCYKTSSNYPWFQCYISKTTPGHYDTVTAYKYNDVSDSLYDFVTAWGGDNLTADNWDTIFNSEEYLNLSDTDKGLMHDALVSDPQGTKTTSQDYADFITKYDQIISVEDVSNPFNRTPLATYTVTIDYDNGDPDGSAKVLPGSNNYKLPEPPEYSGYVFQGWLVNGETKAAGSPITVSENITIKAQWVQGITFSSSVEFKFTGLTMERFQLVFEGTGPSDAKQYGFLVTKTDMNLTSLTAEQIQAGVSGVSQVNGKNKAVLGTGDGSTTVSVVFYYIDKNNEVHYSEMITMSFDSYVTADGFDPSIYGDEYAIAALQYYIAGLQAE